MVRGALPAARRNGRDVPEPPQTARPQLFCQVQLHPGTALLLPGVTPTPPARSRALEKGTGPKNLLRVGVRTAPVQLREQHGQSCACRGREGAPGPGEGSASGGTGGRAAKSLKQLLGAQKKRINETN